MASLGDDLLKVVNKLQDLVFNTIGNDSLDLPQIVSLPDNLKGALIADMRNRWSSGLSLQANRLCSRISLAGTFYHVVVVSSPEGP